MDGVNTRRAPRHFETLTAPRCPNHAKPMREMRTSVWRCDVTGCGLVLDAQAAEKGWRE